MINKTWQCIKKVLKLLRKSLTENNDNNKVQILIPSVLNNKITNYKNKKSSFFHVAVLTETCSDERWLKGIYRQCQKLYIYMQAMSKVIYSPHIFMSKLNYWGLQFTNAIIIGIDHTLHIVLLCGLLFPKTNGKSHIIQYNVL